MREQNTSLEDGPHVGVTRAQCEHALGFNCGSNHLLASPWHSSESDLPDSRRRGSYLCSEPFSLLLWKKKMHIIYSLDSRCIHFQQLDLGVTVSVSKPAEVSSIT